MSGQLRKKISLYFPERLRRAFYALILIGICLASIGVMQRKTEKVVVRQVNNRVQVMQLSPVNQTLLITGYGTVEPSQILDMRPQVNGHVIKIHENLKEGGRIQKNDLLLQIDPRDYEINIKSREADVARAEYELKIEESNQAIAKHEWNLLNHPETQAVGDRELALHIPNIKDKQSYLRAMQSLVERAHLDLSRCSIVSPFDAVVLSESVEVGAYIDQSVYVVKLAATERFNIKVQIPEQQISWLNFDSESGQVLSESTVKVINQIQSDSSNTHFGKVERLLGSVEVGGHMAQLIVSVQEPLSAKESATPLLLGSYVKVEIIGKQLENVYRIPRTAIKERGKVYVADAEQRLRSRIPSILYESEELVLAGKGFESGDKLIVSNLQNPSEGMVLMTEESNSQSES